jgi:hypothetical protein
MAWTLARKWPAAGVAMALLALGSAASADARSDKEAEARKTAREAVGVYNHIKLFPETNEIEFTYGGPTLQRMTFTEFAAFVRARLVGQTVTFLPDYLGYQIEYYSEDGRAYLWYPGNVRTNVGRYVIRESMEPFGDFGDRAGVLICFDYGPNSYNPSTGKSGGEECTSAYAFIASIRGKRQGDVFNLASGGIPFTMTARQFPKWPDGKPLIDAKAPHN